MDFEFQRNCWNSKEFSDEKTMADKSALDEKLTLLIPGQGVE